MNHKLKQIKRLIIQGNYQFTMKANNELEFDGLIIEDALESILNASNIDKVINSKHPVTGKKEKLYIIKSFTYDNLLIYTKGKIAELNGKLKFYVLISSKRSL
ncbi:MAG: hypothetical protein HQK75_08880 [Candidatus Magnetomorum sp.]|nr:hypothetical protein [Candidatus Magnetomorum sp.]